MADLFAPPALSPMPPNPSATFVACTTNFFPVRADRKPATAFAAEVSIPMSFAKTGAKMFRIGATTDAIAFFNAVNEFFSIFTLLAVVLS